MSNAFTVDGAEFRVMSMDPRTQLLVLKRLMRFVPALTASEYVRALIMNGNASQGESTLQIITELAPLLADTPDGDLDFVFDACFDITRQIVDGKAFPVRNPQNGVVSNRDNDAVWRKLMIVVNVIRITFGPMMAQIAPTIAAADQAEAAA